MGASHGFTRALSICAVMLSACSEEWSEDCPVPPSPLSQPNIAFLPPAQTFSLPVLR